MKEKPSKQTGIDERQLVMAGKDNDSITESYSARDKLCEHTAQKNFLFVQKLLETSVKIGYNCNSRK